MKSAIDELISEINKDPSNKSLIYKLDRYIKSNWSGYSDLIYDSYIYDSVFSELLYLFETHTISDNLTLRKFFTKKYRAVYYEVKKYGVPVTEEVYPYVYKDIKLDLSRLTNSEYILLFMFLTKELPEHDPRIAEIISKIRFRSNIEDADIYKNVSKYNIPALYLIDKLGYKGYKEFTDLVTKLGIYYPLAEIPDNELIEHLKNRLIEKYTNKLSELNLNELDILETFL